MSSTTLKPLRIGVYMVPPVQLLDVSPVDVIAGMSREYLDQIPFPDAVKALGIEMDIKYITPGGPSASSGTAEMTAGAALRVTRSIRDADVQPGELDVLMVPGPPPAATFSSDELAFVTAHWNGGNGADILSVCTGIYVVAGSGIVDGRAATGPRGLLPELKKKFPNIDWKEKRFWRDGKLWSSGGNSNGQDMVAQWCRERYPGPLSDVALALSDVGDRGQDYADGKASNTLWWVFTILKAWLKGGKKDKSN